jgi:hypothetical protein
MGVVMQRDLHYLMPKLAGTLSGNLLYLDFISIDLPIIYQSSRIIKSTCLVSYGHLHTISWLLGFSSLDPSIYNKICCFSGSFSVGWVPLVNIGTMLTGLTTSHDLQITFELWKLSVFRLTCGNIFCGDKMCQFCRLQPGESLPIWSW